MDKTWRQLLYTNIQLEVKVHNEPLIKKKEEISHPREVMVTSTPP